MTFFIRKNLRFISAIYVILSISNPAIAEDFYVNNSASKASDSNPGTSTLPWKTIQRGADALRPGDRLFIRPGNYAPFVVNNSGNKNAGPIVISAVPGSERKVIIDGTGHKGPRGLINIRAKSYVHINGFYLKNAPGDGIYVEGSPSGSRDIRIANNRIERTGNSGIYAAGLVMGSTIGINEYRLFDLTVEGNDVSRTNEPSGGNEAITVGGGINGFIIRNNVVHDTQQYGIDCKLGCINGEIYGNHIYNVEKHGIYLDSACRTLENIEVYNNRIHNNMNGITIARESDREPKAPNARNISIYNNLVYDNKQYGIMAYKHVWDPGTGDFKDVSIFNNTVYRNAKHGIFLPSSIAAYASNFLVANNIAYANNTNIKNDMGALERTNLVGVDPLFVAAPDFNLRPNSPAIDKGTTSLAPTLDAEGISRPQGNSVDIGAHEFAVALNNGVGLIPSADAYLRGGTRVDGDLLRVDGKDEVTYMKFNMKSVSPTSQIELELRQAQDWGRGTIRVYLGSHSNWNGGTLSSANRPLKIRQLGSITATFSGGAKYRITLTRLPVGDFQTLILEMDAGGEGVAFSSRTGIATPKLNVNP